MSEKEKKQPIKLIDDPSEIPADLSDEEEALFWETHGLSEEFLERTEEVPADERPRPREGSTPISVRFDSHTLDRLKALAEDRGIGYQTLLKQFVTERLFEEEKREGLVPVTDATTYEGGYELAMNRAAFEKALNALPVSPLYSGITTNTVLPSGGAVNQLWSSDLKLLPTSLFRPYTPGVHLLGFNARHRTRVELQRDAARAFAARALKEPLEEAN